MKLKIRTLGAVIGWALFLTPFIAILSACNSGSGDGDNTNTPSRRSAALSFQLKLASSLEKTAASRAIGAPDICTDYRIETIAVKLYRSRDNTEAVSVQKDCADHSMAIEDIPPSENLYMVVAAHSGFRTNWQQQVNDLVFDPGQTRDLGIVTLKYLGDDTAAPLIASKHPAQDAVGVDLNTWITVVFNEALAPSSIPDQAITVSNNDTPVPGKVGYDPSTHTVYFKPDNIAGLDPEATYRATFQNPVDDNGGLTDIAGHPFIGDAQGWQFTTRSTDDTTAPQVITASPADGAMSVPHSAHVKVLFSEPMDSTSITEGALTLTSDQGAVNGTLAYDDISRTLTLTPEIPLEAETLYTASLSADAKDRAQNPLVEPFTWKFTTSSNKYELVSVKTGNGSGTIKSTDNSGINCGDTCQAELPAGTTVTLEAIADESSEFTGWSGDSCNGEIGPCTFIMTGNIRVTADFNVRYHIVNVSVVPEDGSGGTVSPLGAMVINGDDQSFEFSSKPFHSLTELIVDGQPVAPASSYLFKTVVDSHTIRAVFKSNTVLLSHGLHMNHNYMPQINTQGHVLWVTKKENETFRRLYFDDGTDATNPFLAITSNYSYDLSDKGHVVWWESSATNSDVYYYDGSKITNLTENQDDFPGLHEMPNINNNGQVVWFCRSNGSVNYYYYDGHNVTNISGNYQNKNGFSKPQINNYNHMVWTGSIFSLVANDLFYYDGFEVKNISEQENLSGYHEQPKLNDNGHVVWKFNGENEDKIFYYDGSKAFPISDTSSKPVNLSWDYSINNRGNVVWEGKGENDNSVMYLYDGSETVAIIAAPPGQTICRPQINNNGHIVWQTVKRSNWEFYDYFYYDGSTTFNLTNNLRLLSFKEYSISINDNNHIVWSMEEPSGNVEIYRSFY